MITGMVKPKTYGRMGNFLFQAACALAYGWEHGMPVTLPNETKDAFHNPLYLQHLVRKDFNPSLPSVVVEEEVFSYHKLPFQDKWRTRNIILDGYWQSEKYFQHYREKILDAFAFSWHSKVGFVSVHVRRTDYLKLRNKHPFISKEWITRAMSLFPDYHFFFFSDDIAWCEKEFKSRSDCFFSDSKDPQLDLEMMSCCEHHICSASTFSWWGAWLNRNPNKKVIMPKQWFMPGHGGLDTSDIVPPYWTRI